MRAGPVSSEEEEAIDGGPTVSAASHRLMLLLSSSNGVGFKVMGDTDLSGLAHGPAVDRCEIDSPMWTFGTVWSVASR